MRTSISALFLLAFAAALGQSAKPLFSIDISGPKTVKAGAPIEIKVTLTNTSDHSIDFMAHEPEELNYSTEVFKSNGELAGYTTQGHFIATGTCKVQDADPKGPCLADLGRPAVVSLRPSGKYITWITVTDQFLLNNPNDYSIRVSRSTAGDPKDRVLVKSNALTVTVTP